MFAYNKIKYIVGFTLIDKTLRCLSLQKPSHLSVSYNCYIGLLVIASPDSKCLTGKLMLGMTRN